MVLKGQKTRKRQKTTRHSHQFCNIPIPAPVLNYSYSEHVGNDFYDWVNHEWLTHVKIPSFENDFGVSEEVERCIYEESVKILSNTKCNPLISLRNSLLDENSQKKSIEYIHHIIQSLQCVETVDDIIKHFSALAKSRVLSIFNYQYYITPNSKIHLRLDSNCPSLPISLYQYPEITNQYKDMLDKVGDLFHIDKLSQI
jgi:hypothetical protein